MQRHTRGLVLVSCNLEDGAPDVAEFDSELLVRGIRTWYVAFRDDGI